MSLYGTQALKGTDDFATSNTVLESLYVDDLLRLESSQLKKFCESEEAKILVEKQVLKKPTLMRLSKADDEKRRTKLMAYQLAKENNDPLWEKLKKYQKLRRETINAIMKKYGNKAARMSKIAQKSYIKSAASVKNAAGTGKK